MSLSSRYIVHVIEKMNSTMLCIINQILNPVVNYDHKLKVGQTLFEMKFADVMGEDGIQDKWSGLSSRGPHGRVPRTYNRESL